MLRGWLIVALRVFGSACLVANSAAAQWLVATNQLDGSVSIIESNTNAVVATLDGAGKTPAGVGYCGGDRFAISSPDDGQISLIDARRAEVIQTWQVENGPLGIDCAENEIWVAHWYENQVQRINTNDQSTARFPVGQAPSGVWIDTARNQVYVANRDEDSVSILNQADGKLLTTLDVGDAPFGLGVFNGRLYVVNVRSANVSVIDLASYQQIALVDVGEWAYCIAFDGEANRAFVTNQDEDSVSVIDLDTFSESERFEVGLAPEGIGLSGRYLYVANWQEASISVVDRMHLRELTRITVGKGVRSYGRFIGD